MCILNSTKRFVFAFIRTKSIIATIDYPSAVNQRDRKQPAAKQTNKRAGGGTAADRKHHPSTRDVKLSPPPQVGIHLPLSGPWEGCPDSPSVCPDLCLGLWVGKGDTRGWVGGRGLWHAAAVLTTVKLATAAPNSSPGLPVVLRY